MNAETTESNDDMPARITVEQARAGQWIEPPVSYVNPARRFCAMTGRPIARRYWQVMAGDQELIFCDREQAARYATYPKR